VSVFPGTSALTGLALALLCTPATGTPSPPPGQAEIDYLIAFVGQSACDFKRNGFWYTGEQARQHLQEKLALVVLRTPVSTAEQFISQVASKSAYTGMRYEVRCQGSPVIAVDDWLLQEIRRHRTLPGINRRDAP
jgi:hypothetical protein